MKNEISNKVLSAFLNDPCEIVSFGTGHIHNTYKITKQTTGESFLLQHINHKVFKDVAGMMQNIKQVTAHLAKRLDNKYPGFTTLEVIPTLDNQLFFYQKNYGYWRLCTFIENSIGYDKAISAQQAAEAGKAFGLFQALLSDMQATQLNTTIPDFHNMAYRIDNLDKAVITDAKGRLQEVSTEISFVNTRRKQMIEFYQEIASGKLPIRITHNDTKFNNVLLDVKTHQAKAVVDLDTVMPGSLLYDFGDAIRTICNTCEEDEADTENIDFSIPFFKAFSESYFKEVGQTLTQKEKSLLVFSAKYMTMIMGVRFLTDYLEGDVYYKINHKKHNLQRVKAQFRLIEVMEKNEKALQRIVDEICR